MTDARTDEQDEQLEWAERRRRFIGATDSPKLLGLSKYGTPLTVYHDKVDPATISQPSLPAWLGIKLQRVVGELYTGAMGTRLRADNTEHFHRDLSYIGCHLDFRVWGQPNLLVECKTRAYMHGWGPDGSTIIPVEVWVQVQHEMLVMGAEVCHVAVLFGHHTFHVYPIQRDQPFLDGVVPRLTSFWEDNVLAGVPPDPIGHYLDDRQLRRDHPAGDGSLKAATPEQERIVRGLRDVRRNLDQVQVAKDEAENRIKKIIGDADGLTGSFGTITFKRSKDSMSTDWEAVATTYGNVIEEVMTLVNPGDDPATVSRLARAQAATEAAVDLYTVRIPGSRRFHVKFEEEL